MAKEPRRRPKIRVCLEHIRCFSSNHSIPLCPLTILVGENSAGKSTLLSVISAIFDSARFPATPSFNDPPYSLGTFETIATHKGGRYGRDSTISMGFSVGEPNDRNYRQVVATYEDEHGTVALRALKTISTVGTLDIRLTEKRFSGTYVNKEARSSRSPVEFKGELASAVRLGKQPLEFQILQAVMGQANEERRKGRRTKRRAVSNDFVMGLYTLFRPPFEKAFSLSPIRSKPRRTYDELSEEYDPEGDHVPTTLARLLSQGDHTDESRRIIAALSDFGEDSGLFKKVAVKRLGRSTSSPFQVRINLTGPSVNLVDVGYGVSQVLPIVVQSMLRSSSRLMLLQQPEVHLHPRAQAALGTFLAKLAQDEGRITVVETHSDYLVDRVRQEVAKKSLSPDHVQILFLHKPKHDTEIFELKLDPEGNIENAPEEYRAFFLEEQIRHFGRTE